MSEQLRASGAKRSHFLLNCTDTSYSMAPSIHLFTFLWDASPNGNWNLHPKCLRYFFYARFILFWTFPSLCAGAFILYFFRCERQKRSCMIWKYGESDIFCEGDPCNFVSANCFYIYGRLRLVCARNAALKMHQNVHAKLFRPDFLQKCG